MGVAIVVLLVGVPLGLAMALKPKALWWASSAWRYKKPEANEPSDASYAFTAVGGVLLIVASVVLASTAWSTDRDDRQRAAKSVEESKPYDIPEPQDRGALPVIGYTVESGAYGDSFRLYFLAPELAATAGLRMMNPEFGSCEWRLTQAKRDVADSRQTSVNVTLNWGPRKRPRAGEDRNCSNQSDGRWEVKSDTLYPKSPLPILTDGPVVDRDGTIVAEAAPGNRVPELREAPGGSANRPHR